MARKPVTDMSAWPSLTLEGNLIAPAMVASIDRRQATEQTEADYRIRKGLTIREEISTAFRVGQSHFDAFAKLQNPSARGDAALRARLPGGNLRLRRSRPGRWRGLLPRRRPRARSSSCRRPTKSSTGAARRSRPIVRARRPSRSQDYLNDQRPRALGPRHQRRRDPPHARQRLADAARLYRSRPRPDLHQRGRRLLRRALAR